MEDDYINLNLEITSNLFKCGLKSLLVNVTFSELVLCFAMCAGLIQTGAISPVIGHELSVIRCQIFHKVIQRHDFDFITDLLLSFYGTGSLS